MRFSDEAVLRLLVAVALGAAIGAERESSEQPAGLRTHIAVCLGAALFGVVSTIGFEEFEEQRSRTNVQIDVTRVASQVVVGIGFLGAGIIFRQGTAVRNLTTAASLWVTSAIGLTCGVGDLGTAAVAALVMLIALVSLLPLREWLRRRVTRESRELRIRLRDGVEPETLVDDVRAIDGVAITRVSHERADGAHVVLLEVKGDRNVDLDDRLRPLAWRDDVRDFEEVGGRET